MDATTLRKAVETFFPEETIKEAKSRLGVQMRDRKRDLSCLLAALVMTAGSDDSGRQADVFTRYLEEAEKKVVRGAFYDWFNDPLAALMRELLTHAMETVWEQPPRLTGRLGKVGVKDWILVDSETVTLHDKLADIYPATSTAAGLKVHKYFSLGRNNVVDIEITPARDHDAPVLRLDERWRGMGLIVDLGYVSLDLIRECQRLDILLVIRLKKGSPASTRHPSATPDPAERSPRRVPKSVPPRDPSVPTWSETASPRRLLSRASRKSPCPSPRSPS